MKNPKKSVPTRVRKTCGRPFEIGNPGRPPGSRNKRSALLEELLDGQAEAIIGKVVEKALAGDPVAMRLCMDRMLPRQERPVSLELPAIRSAADGALALAAIVAAVAAGEITSGQGAELSHSVTLAVSAFQAKEMDDRARPENDPVHDPEHWKRLHELYGQPIHRVEDNPIKTKFNAWINATFPPIPEAYKGEWEKALRSIPRGEEYDLCKAGAKVVFSNWLKSAFPAEPRTGPNFGNVYWDEIRQLAQLAHYELEIGVVPEKQRHFAWDMDTGQKAVVWIGAPVNKAG